jgi:nucleotide-binding universal stress UspA family protein
LIPPDLAGRVEVHVSAGPAAAEIARWGRETKAKMIVLGAHSRGFIDRVFFGVTAYGVLRSAECPLWIVPRRARLDVAGVRSENAAATP